jgi:hypothetical protein
MKFLCIILFLIQKNIYKKAITIFFITDVKYDQIKSLINFYKNNFLSSNLYRKLLFFVFLNLN